MKPEAEQGPCQAPIRSARLSSNIGRDFGFGIRDPHSGMALRRDFGRPTDGSGSCLCTLTLYPRAAAVR